MNTIFHNLYHKTWLGKQAQWLYHTVVLPSLSDKQYGCYRYKKHMGKKLRLDPPQTLNEKINWLKLYDRTPLHTQCADKFAVREYIAKNIGEYFLVPLYMETTEPKNITKDVLEPFVPCIIKANHDSSGGIFVRNVDSINWKDVQDQLAKRLSTNYYKKSREWQYKNIEPRIIVEKLLQTKDGQIPLDYKIHCLNGKPRMIQVDIGRGSANHYRNWYNTQWKREPYKWSSPKENNEHTDPSPYDIDPPDTLEQMLDLSKSLSEKFTYVRVDWYDVDGKLYFGELTFHHDGGNKPILPSEWDLHLGQELQLPMKP